jgi:hypothetical protein
LADNADEKKSKEGNGETIIPQKSVHYKNPKR